MCLDEPMISPRGRTISGAPDSSTLFVDEREEVGRCIRLARPVRRGEALLVEDPLFLSPADDLELEELLVQICDAEAIAAARAASPAAASASSASPSIWTTNSHWLPAPEQLSLVAIQALIERPDCPEVEGLRTLSGDPERWSAQAARLWYMLREDNRARIAVDVVCEVYAIVASNAHTADGGRAGLFPMGSFFEHSCAPTAFKEVVDPMEGVPRPGSPCHGIAEAASPPRSPVGHTNERRPQLVVRALRDLGEDDIVSISYIPEYLPTWKRRELLQASYGFFCGCDRCLRSPELVCAFRCFKCGLGPCSPTAPSAAVDGSLRGLSLRCEACDAMATEDSVLDALTLIEASEVVSEESTRHLHPFHWKIYQMYLMGHKDMLPVDRIQALDQLQEAQRRLAGSDSHPLLGRLCEIGANTQVEIGDLPRAAASFQRAAELYAVSHRVPPHSGHDRRCYEQKTRIAAGRIGAVPRRLSRVSVNSRSPSLPSLAEAVQEDCET